RHTLLFRFDEVAEDLGPTFLEVGVALQSALQHGSYAVLGFGPRQCCPKRSEGVQKPIGWRQRDLVDEILCRGEGASIEGADPAREGVDEAVQFGIRKGSVDINASFRCIPIKVVRAQNDFECPTASDQVRKALRPSAAGM